jgi:hypothetical protein
MILDPVVTLAACLISFVAAPAAPSLGALVASFAVDATTFGRVVVGATSTAKNGFEGNMGVALLEVAEEAKPTATSPPVIGDNNPLFTILPSLSLHSSTPTPLTPSSNLLAALPTSPFHDRVFNPLAGVPVA